MMATHMTIDQKNCPNDMQETFVDIGIKEIKEEFFGDSNNLDKNEEDNERLSIKEEIKEEYIEVMTLSEECESENIVANTWSAELPGDCDQSKVSQPHHPIAESPCVSNVQNAGRENRNLEEMVASSHSVMMSSESESNCDDLSISSDNSSEESSISSAESVNGEVGLDSSLWVRVYAPENASVRNMVFLQQQIAPINIPNKNAHPLKYVSLFLTDDIIEKIVLETNKYAEEFLAEKAELIAKHPHSRVALWKPVDSGKIKKFLGLYLLMGLVSVKNVKDYWSTHPEIRLPFFAETMPRDEFFLISRFFRLIDNSRLEPMTDPNYDPWVRLRPFLDSCNALFKRHYQPEQTISIKESMIRMRNRRTYLQYMPKKHHSRFGVRKIELCEARTGYVYHIDLYSGKHLSATASRSCLACTLTKNIMKKSGLLGKGYHLITDKFFSKVKLAEELLDESTYMTGTIGVNSKLLPKIVTGQKLKAGETVYARKGHLLTCGFKEKSGQKPVYLLSSFGQAENITIYKANKYIVKPKIIHDYNTSMVEVTVNDKNLYQYAAQKPMRQFWKRIFMNLLDISVLNAYVIYKNSCDNPVPRSNFIRLVVSGLCTRLTIQHPLVPASPSSLTGADHTYVSSRMELGHSYAHLEGNRARICGVCGKRSRHWCPGCNVAIHEACWHHLEHYYRPRGLQKRKRGEHRSKGLQKQKRGED